jgi:hypothetical protein
VDLWTTTSTVVADGLLEPLLKLADEYDVKHVNDKCEAFIKDRLQFTVTTHAALRYLQLAINY